MTSEDNAGPKSDANERVISAMVETQDSPPSRPVLVMEGSFRSSLQVLGAFFILFNVW